MVLRITKIMGLQLLLSFFFLTACEELAMVDCSECTVIEPKTCNLRIELGEVYGSGLLYDVTIYRGLIKDGVVIYNVQTYTSFSYNVSLNSVYSVTVSVEKFGKEYIAVDSTRPRVEVISDVCEEICYLVRDNTLNMEIKYY
ncbi:MAG TPA: hypothetical protein ENH59_08365 [Bacteroidetes bacterium]|nr:hypothetical protein [Bacteroidota bacterium]